MQRLLSTGTLVGLLIATAAAFAITERLEVGAIDAAENETPVIGVSTDAKRHGWLIGARRGFARGPVLTLRAPISPGTYPLTATEHGHSDGAVMVVVR